MRRRRFVYDCTQAHYEIYASMKILQDATLLEPSILTTAVRFSSLALDWAAHVCAGALKPGCTAVEAGMFPRFCCSVINDVSCWYHCNRLGFETLGILGSALHVDTAGLLYVLVYERRC